MGERNVLSIFSKWMDAWMHGWMDGWMGERKVLRMSFEWMDGWMDGWMLPAGRTTTVWWASVPPRAGARSWS